MPQRRGLSWWCEEPPAAASSRLTLTGAERAPLPSRRFHPHHHPPSPPSPRSSSALTPSQGLVVAEEADAGLLGAHDAPSVHGLPRRPAGRRGARAAPLATPERRARAGGGGAGRGHRGEEAAARPPRRRLHGGSREEARPPPRVT